MKWNILLLFLAIAVAQPSRLSCPTSSFTLVKGIAMQEMTCTGNNLSLNPELPDGLYFINKKLYGTPVRGQQRTEYYVTDGTNYVKVYIGIYDMPTTISYGFDSQKIVVNVPMDSLPMRSNTIFSQVTVSPSLPTGISINNITGLIYGTPTQTSSTTQYQITATNTFGSISTTINISFIQSSELSTNGFSGCYYARTLGCSMHSMEWFTSNEADKCQLETKFEFSDQYRPDDDSHSWSGLDERFLDYFTAIFTGYIRIFTDATYTFSIVSDDGSILYIDNTIVVNNDGCSRNGPLSKSNTASLTAGIHLVHVLYMQHGGTAPQLSIKYKSTTASIAETIIDSTIMTYAGRGPSFLAYKDIMGAMNSRIPNRYPTIGSGIVTSYTITPTLPNGLTIDPTTGVIAGIPTVSSASTSYTVTATGPMGTASTKFNIYINTELLPGLTGSYYTVSTSNVCSLQYFSLGLLSKQVERIDYTINWEESEDYIWPGLPVNFGSNFFTEFNGYLYIPATGTYTLAINSMDGARVYIDDTLAIRQWGCMTAMNTTTYERIFDTIGYHTLFIEYFAHTTHFGLQFQWKTPTTTTFEAIPASSLYHLPSAQFTYTSPVAHYYKGVTIPENGPVLFGLSSLSPYTITPTLPSGLSFNTASGAITGIPTEEIDLRDYYITSTTQTTQSTMITIQITYIEPPSGLVVRNGTNGSPITSVVLSMTDTINWSIAYNHTASSLTISPNLPSGITLSTRNRRISGTPKESLAPTIYTLTASNDGGSAIYQFTLSVTGCQYGNSFNFVTDNNYQGSITLKIGEEVKESKTNIRGAITWALCIPMNVYDVVAICSGRNTCTYSVTRNDNIIYIQESIAATQASTRSFDTTFTVKPTITMGASLVSTSSGFVFTPISITVNAPHTTLLFSPSLPRTVSYNSIAGTLSGQFNEVGTFAYTLTCSNTYGSDSKTLTFHVGSCDNGNYVVSFTRASAAIGDFYSVTKDGVSIYSETWTSAANTYSYKVCIGEGTYTVKIGTTNTEGGWATYSQLKVLKGDDEILGSFMLASNEKEMTKYFTLKYSLSANSAYTYSNIGTVPNQNWYKYEYVTDNSWQTGKTGSWGTFKQNGVAFFRSEFSVDDIKKYPIFQYDILVRDGYILYMNGVEVMRKNVDARATSMSHASKSYDDIIYRKASISSSFLRNGINKVAVSIHQNTKMNTTIYFDFAVQLLEGTCVLRSVYGLPKDSEHYQNRQNTPAMAFDDRTGTSWRENGLPGFIQYSWYYDRSEYINKVVLTSGNTFNRRHPRKFTLSGSEDGETFKDLLSVNDDGLFTSAFQDVNIWMTEHTNSYNVIRMTVDQSNDDSNYAELSGIGLYSCTVNYCKSDSTWPSTSANEYATIRCPSGYIGTYRRFCRENGYDAPIWDEPLISECYPLVPPKDIVYIDFSLISNNATTRNYESQVKPRLITIFRNNLGVSSEQIAIFDDVDCAYGSIERMCSSVRITTPSSESKDVYNRLIDIQPKLTALVYDGASRFFPQGLTFVVESTPVLRTLTDSTLIIIIIAVVVILVLLIAIGLVIAKRFTIKKRSHSISKPRRKSSVNLSKSKKSSPTSTADKDAKKRRDSTMKQERKKETKNLI
ncbi:hypothetical protein WA158_005719 [Blastocystis sp. Blastoise]